MFSEIRKSISLHAAPKRDLRFGVLSFTVNERTPNLTSRFGATHHVPAGGARCTRSPETFATIICVSTSTVIRCRCRRASVRILRCRVVEKSRVANRSVAMRLGRLQTFYRCAGRESRGAQCNANMCGCEEKQKCVHQLVFRKRYTQTQVNA